MGCHVDVLVLPISCLQNADMRIGRNGAAAVCAFSRINFTQFFQARLADRRVKKKNFFAFVF